jgi:hypothetical protein
MTVHQVIVTLESVKHGRMELLVTELIPGETYSVVGLDRFKFIDATFHRYNGKVHGKRSNQFEREIIAAVGAFLDYQSKAEQESSSTVS